MSTIENLQALNDRQPEVVALTASEIKEAAHSDADAVTLGQLIQAAALQRSAFHAAKVGRLIRRLFGPSVERALFDKEHLDDCTTRFRMLAVYAGDGDMLWYNPELLHGTRFVRERDHDEATGGRVTPALEGLTQHAIETFARYADELAGSDDGYLSVYDGDLGDYASEYGHVVELVINQEVKDLAKHIGEPAFDGSTGPQRRLLSPRERELAARVLRAVVDGLANHSHRPLRQAVRIDTRDWHILAEVAAALDPRPDNTEQTS